MGLTVEAKNFFKRIITEKLDEKITATKKGADENVLRDTAHQKLLNWLCDEHLYCMESDIREYERLLKKTQELENKLVADAKNSKIGYVYRADSLIHWLECKEISFQDEAFELAYPEKAKEIKRLEDAKKNLDGALYLATSETKLAMAVLDLMKAYEIDVAGLETVLSSVIKPS